MNLALTIVHKRLVLIAIKTLFPIQTLILRWARSPKRKRATSTRSYHIVFTDQFILRTVLARILNTSLIPQTSQQNLQT